jgi:hypothetical protein
MLRCRHASLALPRAPATSRTLNHYRATFSSACMALRLGARTIDRIPHSRRLVVHMSAGYSVTGSANFGHLASPYRPPLCGRQR